MIDPRTQYILYKEQENALMAQIKQKLAAQERAEYVETDRPWYSVAGQWLKERIFAPVRIFLLGNYPSSENRLLRKLAGHRRTTG